MSFGNLARRPLSLASVFDLCQWMVGAPACHRRLLRDFVMPRPGDRVVDLGCGTGGTFRYFPDGISYVGLDINPHYIQAAQERYPGRGTFVCCDAVTADLSRFPPFDTAISVGVLHHLTDAEATALLQLASRILRPGGRLVTMDPCYVAGQHSIAKFLKDHDRGKYIRDAERYRRLFPTQGSLETKVFSNMLRIPYNHIVATLRFD